MASVSSASAQVGPWTYFFLNKSDEDGIQFYRWQKVTSTPEKGFLQAAPVTKSQGSAVANIVAGETGIAVLPPDGNNTLRLYYILTSGKTNVLCEIFLENADSVKDAAVWKNGNLDDFPDGQRVIGPGTGLSASYFKDDKSSGHRVYFETSSRKQTVVNFAQCQDSAWTFGTVQTF